MTHSTTDSVRMVVAAFLPRSASWTWKDVASDSKRGMVGKLLEAQVLLCFPEVCERLYASMAVSRKPGATLVQAAAVAVTPERLGPERLVRPVATETPPKVRSSMKRKGFVESSSSGSDSESADGSASLTKVLGQLVKKLGRECATSADKAAKGATPPFQRHMATSWRQYYVSST
jgi:hypothetical protein